MRIATTFALAAMLAASGSAIARPSAAERGQERLDKLLAGRVAGKPVSCISLHNIQSSEIIDRTAIVYRVGGGRLYLNRPEMGRESLNDDDIMVTKTVGSQLCRIDTVRLVDRGSRFETGFVGLGDFVPYSRAPKRN
jgi:hypothetical protein